MRELTDEELNLISGGYYDDEDIVVIGPPGFPSTPVFPVFPVFPGYTQPPPPPPPYGGGGNPPSPPPPPPSPDVGSYEIDTSLLGPLTPAQQAAIDTLRSAATSLRGILNDPNASGTWSSTLGDVRLSELALRMDYADFKILPDNYPVKNGSDAIPGTGFADFNGGNPQLSIRISDLVTYMSTPANQHLYLIHELVHVTGAGQNNFNAMYLAGSDGGTSRTDAEHARNEQWANAMAQAIASSFDLSFPNNPTGGFGDNPITFSR